MNSAAVKKSVTRPKIVNLKKENLNKIGFDSLKDWYYVPDNVYAGCNLHKYLHVEEIYKQYIPDVAEFWNPFSVAYFGVTESLRRYKEFMLSEKRSKVKALANKNIGCYCDGESCHVVALLECFDEIIEDEHFEPEEF